MKDYYANQHGVQLQDFLVAFSDWQLKTWNYNFTMPQGFFLLNALKYKVRAGKKEDNTLESDLQKLEDYINLAVKSGFERGEVEERLKVMYETFEKWDGGVVYW